MIALTGRTRAPIQPQLVCTDSAAVSAATEPHSPGAKVIANTAETTARLFSSKPIRTNYSVRAVSAGIIHPASGDAYADSAELPAVRVFSGPEYPRGLL